MIDPDFRYEYENHFDIEAESLGYIKLRDLPDLDAIALCLKVLSHYKDQMPVSCKCAVEDMQKEMAIWV